MLAAARSALAAFAADPLVTSLNTGVAAVTLASCLAAIYLNDAYQPHQFAVVAACVSFFVLVGKAMQPAAWVTKTAAGVRRIVVDGLPFDVEPAACPSSCHATVVGGRLTTCTVYGTRAEEFTDDASGHPADSAFEQTARALDNLEAILACAGVTSGLDALETLTVYYRAPSTSPQCHGEATELREARAALRSRVPPSGVWCPIVVLGVAQLPIPEGIIALQAVAHV